MKKVSLKGKLSLKKETMSNLSNSNMMAIVGGATAGCGTIASAHGVNTINICVGHTAQTACACPSMNCPTLDCVIDL
jgi:natural product precursor